MNSFSYSCIICIMATHQTECSRFTPDNSRDKLCQQQMIKLNGCLLAKWTIIVLGRLSKTIPLTRSVTLDDELKVNL